MNQLAKKKSWAEQRLAWKRGKNISKTRWRRRRWNAWRMPSRVGIWFHSLSLPAFCRRNSFQHRWRKDFAKRCGKGPIGKASGLFWTHGMLWVCAQRLASGTFRGNDGPHGELFFFFTKKRSPLLLQRQWSSSPLFLRRRSGHVLRLVYT